MKFTRNHYKIIKHFNSFSIQRSPLSIGVLFNHFVEFRLMSLIEDCHDECKTDEEEIELCEMLIKLNIEYVNLFLDEYGFEYKPEETLEDMFPGEYKGNEKL